MPVIGSVLTPLAKNILTPLGLTEAASATDAAIHSKMFGSGTCPSGLASRTTLIISNEEMNIMKIVKSREVSGSKSFSQTIKNEAKEHKGWFLRMLLVTLGASLLGNLLTGKEAITTSQGQEANMPGDEAQLEQVKAQLELVKEQLELTRIFNATSSFNKF